MAFLSPTTLHPKARSQIREITHRKPPSCSYDTILIGSGLSSLSTAALLHKYDPTHKTLILESHTTPGGAAHTFQRRCQDGPLTFESGPHLFSGLMAGDDNPLGQLFQACDIQPEVITYDTWGVFLGESYTSTKVPGDVLMGELLTPQGRLEMTALTNALEPYGRAAKALSVACVRPDIGVLRVLARRAPRLVKHLRYVTELSQPFETFLKQYVKDPLTYALVNLLCFLLAGVTAERIPLAEVAFMFSEWCGATEGVLQRPIGGGRGIVDELVKFIRAHGGVIRTNSGVRRILTQDGAVQGVELVNGDVIECNRVVSGVSTLDLDRLVGVASKSEADVCESFLHLHLAVKLSDLEGVIPGGRLEANYVVVEDILGDLEAAGNVVLISVPSVIDATTAPPGWVTVHAYTPATEPWAAWEGLEGDAYDSYKRARSKVVWRAVNRMFGCDVEQVAAVALVGTPRTHGKYLFRERGSYGARVDARLPLMGLPRRAAVSGLSVVGDGTFPGVGVPAVVGSAWIAANGRVGVRRQEELLRELGL